MTQTVHQILQEQAALCAVADAAIAGRDVLVHGAPGSGGTTFLRQAQRCLPGMDRHFRQIGISYHRAIRDDQRHNPLSREACDADLILLDDFACGYDREGPFKTRGKQLIAFTATPYTEVALSHWNSHFTRPEPAMTVKILSQGSFIITRELCHV